MGIRGKGSGGRDPGEGDPGDGDPGEGMRGCDPGEGIPAFIPGNSQQNSLTEGSGRPLHSPKCKEPHLNPPVPSPSPHPEQSQPVKECEHE